MFMGLTLVLAGRACDAGGSRHAGISSLASITPAIASTRMLTVPIPIPVSTDFPVPLSDTGDITGASIAGGPAARTMGSTSP